MIDPTRPDQLASCVDLGVDAIVLVDVDGVIRWAGSATPAVLGYEPGELVGIRVRDLVEAVDRDAW